MGWRDVPPKEEWPKPGYYYKLHKRGANDPAEVEAFYIAHVGSGVGEELRENFAQLLIYYPLSGSAFVNRHNPPMADVAPLWKFFEPVEIDGEKKPRFTRIENEMVLSILRIRRQELYPDEG